MKQSIEFMDIKKLQRDDLEPLAEEGIDYRLAIKNHLLFSKIENENIVVLNENYLSDALNYLSKLSVDYDVYRADDLIFESLKNKYLEKFTDNEFDHLPSNNELIEVESDLLEFIQKSQDLLASENSAPIIKLVNSLFFQALKKGASDIHIQTMQHDGEVRFRIDGVLKKHINLEKHIINSVINRIKVVSNLDISEKRIPQDGRTQISISSKTVDVRVSTLPTYYGERVVMRILMQSESIPTLEQLGFEENLTKEFYKLLHHSHGMILVTGPTGSGKSTTLHSFLQYMSTPEKNIITIEDPVEYNSPNVSQIQTNDKVGLSFATGLRSILRQDPDIIMVGEIRDTETAKIALQAALTGHLLLSTLHTNNATASLTRLIDMGIKDYLLSSTLLGVLAQRLVRILCPHCKEKTNMSIDQTKELELSNDTVFYTSCGCEHCDFTGFSGRKAVGELFVVNNSVKELIKERLNDTEIRNAMRILGMTTISDTLKEMLVKGQTSYEEALRVGLLDG